jgi:dipeptide/tripeptide permease
MQNTASPAAAPVALKRASRSPFPRVFWVANSIEVLERFSYYGIYFGFGIYMAHLGFSRGQIGFVQGLLLTLSYGIPVFSGSFADRFGFKKVLIVSYLAYLPSILLLLVTQTFPGIVVTIIFLGLAAGTFKPLVAGTVRVVTDSSNKTLGFGIFYAMVNIGGTLGPIIAGHLRAISWNTAFLAAAISIVVMLLVTLFFYEEPPREKRGKSVGETLREIGVTLADWKFAIFLLLLGIFWWIPFWAFYNLCALYTDSSLDTARLYQDVRWFFSTLLFFIPGAGDAIANFLSQEKDGTRHILAETISNTGWMIMFLQVFVSRAAEKARAMPAFMLGLLLSGLGFFVIGRAATISASLLFLGIALFALGEMLCSPRIQEYITWIAPKDKAGLYMGSNFLGTMIGAASGPIYTPISDYFLKAGVPGRVWDVMALNVFVAIGVFWLFRRIAGEFKEMES